MKNYGCLLCCKQKQQSNSDADLNEANLEANPLQASPSSVLAGAKSWSTKKYYNTIIVDFSSVQYVDEAGCKCLKEVVYEYTKDGIKIFFTNCNRKLIFFLT
jgi:hypothetical protein